MKVSIQRYLNNPEGNDEPELGEINREIQILDEEMDSIIATVPPNEFIPVNSRLDEIETEVVLLMDLRDELYGPDVSTVEGYI